MKDTEEATKFYVGCDPKGSVTDRFLHRDPLCSELMPFPRSRAVSEKLASDMRKGRARGSKGIYWTGCRQCDAAVGKGS